MSVKSFVLVHGGYQAGWCWQPVAKRLETAGHRVLTPTLPGMAAGDDRAGRHLSEAVDHLVSEVESRDLRDVVLVAQSWGGYPMTGAAHRLTDRLAGIVYYNALVPERGVPLIGENEDYKEMLLAAIAASPDGTHAVLWEQMPLMVPDWDEQATRFLFDLLVPQPGGYLTEALDVDPVTTLGVPVAYLSAETDLVLARPGHVFAARLNLTPTMVPGGHEGMLTHPDEIAAALLESVEKM